MMQYGLTPEQARCLAVIRAYAAEGRVPTYDEMRTALGLGSKSGVNRLIMALEERGHIVRLPNRQRSIRLVAPPARVPPAPAAWMATDIALRQVFADEDVCRAFASQFGGRVVPLYEHPPSSTENATSATSAFDAWRRADNALGQV